VCSGQSCPIYKVCPATEVPLQGDECTLKADYLRGVWQLITSMYPRYESDPALKLRANYHLIPLYQALLAAYIDFYAYNTGVINKPPKKSMNIIRDSITLIEATLTKMDSLQDEYLTIDSENSNNNALGYYERLLHKPSTPVDMPFDTRKNGKKTIIVKKVPSELPEKTYR